MKGPSKKIIYLQVIHVIFLKQNKLATCHIEVGQMLVHLDVCLFE